MCYNISTKTKGGVIMFRNNLQVCRIMRGDYDFLNEDKLRNIRNTHKKNYNCGGYALKTFSWYVPQYTSWYIDKASIFAEMVESILEDFPNLRRIQDPNQVNPNTEIIAFRINYRGHDFHFLRRAVNGHWFHKRGATNYISTITKKEVFSDCWCDCYYGEIAWFVER